MCDSLPLDIIVGEGTNVLVSPIGNASMITFFVAPRPINLGAASLTLAKVLAEPSGQELVWGVPVTMPALLGSTPFEAHYFSFPSAAEIVLIPFVGHMALFSVSPTAVLPPNVCLGGAATVPLTTTLVLDDGPLFPPVVASVTRPWQCLAGGGIQVVP